MHIPTPHHNNYQPSSTALLAVGDIQWSLTQGTHTMRSTSDAGEPTFIFSNVHELDPDTFYCVILRRSKWGLLLLVGWLAVVLLKQRALGGGKERVRWLAQLRAHARLITCIVLITLCTSTPSNADHPSHELEVLQQVLGKLSILHMSKNVKKNQVPFNLPQIDPNIVSTVVVRQQAMYCGWVVKLRRREGHRVSCVIQRQDAAGAVLVVGCCRARDLTPPHSSHSHFLWLHHTFTPFHTFQMINNNR